MEAAKTRRWDGAFAAVRATCGPAEVRATLTWREVVLAAAFFAVALWAFTRANDFPSFYHPDESTKAAQVIGGKFNFNHPLLLLQSARVISWLRGTPPETQAITEDGRLATALFAAGAVAMVVLLAAHLRGAIAGAAAGLLVLANSQLFELSHYMKEDPALAFGVVLFFLALVRCWLAVSPGRIALLGAAAAVAVSGKYIGALVVPLAVLPLVWRRRVRLWEVGLLVGVFVVALGLINFPMAFAVGELSGNVGREIDYAVHGHKGISRSVPHGVYWRVFLDATNPAIWLLLAWYYLGLLAGRRAHPAEWTVALAPVAYMIFLSFFPKTHHRYFLPDTILLCLLAGIAAVPWGRTRWSAVRTILFAAALTLSVGKTFTISSAFHDDARRRLIAFVRENLPADATIVQDRRVSLPDPNDRRQSPGGPHLDQTIVGKTYAADAGTLDDLRREGIRYVAVCNASYGRFLREGFRPAPEERDDFERRREFYQRLFAEGQLLWESPQGPLQYFQPAMQLYYLPPAGPGPPR